MNLKILISSPFVCKSESEQLVIGIVYNIFCTFTGVYQSHWRLSHHGLYFGHRVWCHIIVDEKEVLEHSDQEKESVLTIQREEYELLQGSEVSFWLCVSN